MPTRGHLQLLLAYTSTKLYFYKCKCFIISVTLQVLGPTRSRFAIVTSLHFYKSTRLQLNIFTSVNVSLNLLPCNFLGQQEVVLQLVVARAVAAAFRSR